MTSAMRTSALGFAIAGAAIVGAIAVSLMVAQDAPIPSKEGTVVIPESSKPKGEDKGIRGHTNVEVFVPPPGSPSMPPRPLPRDQPGEPSKPK
jgi:hypothetical protein